MDRKRTSLAEMVYLLPGAGEVESSSDPPERHVPLSLHVLLTLRVLLAQTCGPEDHNMEEGPTLDLSGSGIVQEGPLHFRACHSSACDLPPKLYWNSGFETEMFMSTFPLTCLVSWSTFLSFVF